MYIFNSLLKFLRIQIMIGRKRRKGGHASCQNELIDRRRQQTPLSSIKHDDVTKCSVRLKRIMKEQEVLVFKIVCFIAGYLGQFQTGTGPN